MLNINRPRPADILVLLFIITVLHLIALEHKFYWFVWWYDIMMHFLAGFWIMLTLIWLNRSGELPIIPTLTKSLIFILVVGLAWEIYELWFGLTFTGRQGYYADTATDLVLDLVGGGVAYFLLFPKKLQPN